jgi:hypothetical protein
VLVELGTQLYDLLFQGVRLGTARLARPMQILQLGAKLLDLFLQLLVLRLPAISALLEKVGKHSLRAAVTIRLLVIFV